MKRNFLIIFNVVLILFLLIVISQEYIRIGKFQWVDRGSIEDNEELYLTPIFVIFIFTSLSSIGYEIFQSRKNNTLNNLIKLMEGVFKAVSNIHGFLLIFFSIIGILMALENIGNHDLEKDYIFSIILVLSTLLCIGTLGLLTIFKNAKKKQ